MPLPSRMWTTCALKHPVNPATLPLLMFQNSFGNALHSLMAESFSSAVFSRTMPYNMELTWQSGAKYVIIELVERNLARVAEDGSTRVWEAFPVYTGEGTACTGYLPDDGEEVSRVYGVPRGRTMEMGR